MTAQNEYNAAKERYPNSLVGFELDGNYLFFGEDAKAAAEILGSKLLDKPLEHGGVVETTGFPANQWVYYSRELWSKGENVCLYGEQDDGTHAQIKYLSGKDYLPIDSTVHIDGREFRVDTVDFARGKVSLQDMTMAREARYPLFREEPVEFVRTLYEQEEPQFDFATEEQVFIAIQQSRYTYEDFSGEQMDAIYAAAQKNLNLLPMLNPDFSVEQMQLIADIEDRVRKNERVAYDGMLMPLTGHVMTPEEINAARKEYRLPLEPFTQTSDSPGELAPSTQPAVTQEKRNFHITDDNLGAGGPKAKFRANMDAIQLPWYAGGCGRSIPRSQVPAVYGPLLPQRILGHASFQGKAGGKDAQSDPRPGKQEICPGESQSRGGGTALYEAERGRQEGGGWH